MIHEHIDKKYDDVFFLFLDFLIFSRIFLFPYRLFLESSYLEIRFRSLSINFYSVSVLIIRSHRILVNIYILIRYAL